MEGQITKRRIVIYLLLLALAGLMVVSVTYSRFTSQVDGKAEASIAVWESASEINIDAGGLKPGESKEFSFAVMNNKDGKVSDVAQEYSITLKTTNNLPLTYELSQNSSKSQGGGTSIGNAPFKGIETNGTSVLTGGTLPPSTAATHTYTLTVTWPANKNSVDYADEIDMITLTVDAEQAEPK